MGHGAPSARGRRAGGEGRTKAGGQPSPPGNAHTAPCSVWGSLAGPPSMPRLPRLVKDCPATQGAGETGTSPGQPLLPSPQWQGKIQPLFSCSLLLSVPPAWMQQPHSRTQGPQSQPVLGASLWGPPPPVQTLTCWRQEWGWLSSISSWRADPSHPDCLLAPYHGQHALPHQARISPQTQALPLSP